MSTPLLERQAPPLHDSPTPSVAADSSPGESSPSDASLKATKPKAPAAPAIQIVVVRQLSELERYLTAWEELAVSSCEPNVFYEPWMLIPSIKAFAEGKPMEYYLVFAPDRGPDTPNPLLYGFFPFERRRKVKGVPVRSLVLWKHLYSMLCTPLVRRGHEAETIHALLNYCDVAGSAPQVMEWNSVPADRAFGQALVEVFRERRTLTFVDECWNRSLIRPNSKADGNEYLKNALSSKRRKELKRQENRLMESGSVEYADLNPEDYQSSEYENADLEKWIEQFLELESSGWKGQEGSAFACQPNDREFFRTILTEGYRRRRLMMLSLLVNGKPIALKCDFLAGNGAFAFKIAYDEQHSRFSPGVLLEIEGIQRLHRNSRIRWMDSGAVPNHFMINRLWTERRTLQNLVIATKRRRGEFVVSFLPVLRYIRRIANRVQKRAGQSDTHQQAVPTPPAAQN